MASFDTYWPKLQREEGTTYVEDPSPTVRGITLATWKAYGYDKNGDGVNDVRDLKLITAADAYRIYKHYYWDKCKADQINNQSLAELVTDYVINGGPAISTLQKAAGRPGSGTMTTSDVVAINAHNAALLFGELWLGRQAYYYKLANENPAKAQYLKGWLNRLNRFSFSPLGSVVTTGLGVGGILIGGAVAWLVYHNMSSKSNQ